MFEGLVSALFQRLTAVLTLEDMMGVVMGKLIILCSLEKTADISPRHNATPLPVTTSLKKRRYFFTFSSERRQAWRSERGRETRATG